MGVPRKSRQQLLEELARCRTRIEALERAAEAGRRRELALRESDLRFRSIFEQSNDGILLVDPDRDEILDANQTACRMLGYTQDELLATPISTIHSVDHERLVRFTARVFAVGRGSSADLCCLRKDGTYFPAEVSASVIEVEGRSCLVAMVRDITERKAAEETIRRHTEELEREVAERTAAIARSEARLRLLLEINNALITHLDRQRLFAAIAQALERLLSFERASLTLVDLERGVVTVHGLVDPSPTQPYPVGSTFPLAGSTHELVFARERPRVRYDLRQEARLAPEDKLLEDGVLSYVMAPLIVHGRPLGAINVGSRLPRRYDARDAELLHDVARQVALAVDNMLAYEEIARLRGRPDDRAADPDPASRDGS